MRRFRWLGPSQLAEKFDLRHFDWRLVENGDSAAAPGDDPCLLLADRQGLPLKTWIRLLGLPDAQRGLILLAGVGHSEERARLLQLGIGDLTEPGVAPAELAARGARILDSHGRAPMRVTVGPLVLDLAAREGFTAGRRMGLHPREFALLWRLALRPGEPVSQQALLAEVWHLSHRPETNSLAVHVSRLRAKLRIAGLGGILASCSQGYVLQPGLDAPDRIGKEAANCGKDLPQCSVTSNPTTASRLPSRIPALPMSG